MNTVGYIPFINSKSDCDIFKKIYSDAKICRVLIDRADVWRNVVSSEQLWIDTGFDGFSQPLGNRGEKWKDFIKQFGETDFLLESSFIAKPCETKLRPLVFNLLDLAAKEKPTYISVPQYPHLNDVSHNKLNRLLAELTLEWRQSRSLTIKFVLPIIFTNQKQLNGKTERGPKVKLCASLISRSTAEGYWCVDCSLDDQKGTGNFDTHRFPAMADFFEELNACSDCYMKIAGPYWGLNLLLWSKGLATHFAIGIGSTFNHHVSGGFGRTAKTRIAISCLRRWVIANNELEIWLDAAALKLPKGSPERNELELLRAQLIKLYQGDAAKRQIALVYKEWIKKIEVVSPQGRALALYQDLSTAFVIGRNLPDLPSDEGTARRPERVAQQLMLNCL